MAASRMTLDAELLVERDGFRLDVSLRVAAGEVVAVLGPNGAGKSTLLRALAGLQPVTGGRISLAGRSVGEAPPQERRIGMVFQDYRLFPHLTALDNVAFGPRSTGTGKAAARGVARDWLGRLGLAEQAQRRPAELSGGQAQRVALARALCTEPDLLLLDEPLSALDAAARVDVRAQLQSQLASYSGATLLVTHEPLEALSLADRLVVLEDGRITQDAAPADILRRPATAYAARLAGLNLLHGTARDGVLELRDEGRLVLADSDLAGPVLAVVRPSALQLQRQKPGPTKARNVLPARVLGLEPLGERVRVSLASAPPLIADVTAAAVADLRLLPGDEVWVSFKATEVDAYPEATPS
jgi:molybdate transport system ATP-binding protein